MSQNNNNSQHHQQSRVKDIVNSTAMAFERMKKEAEFKDNELIRL
jgi:hypothetical protein